MQEVIKYPYLPAAKQLLGEGQSVVGYEEIEAAAARVVDSVSAGLRKPRAKRALTFPSPKQAVEIFAASRLLACLLDSEYYLSAFARGEARYAGMFLAEEAPEDFDKLLAEFFPSLQKINYENQHHDGQKWSISIFDYLSAGDALAQEELSKGQVLLSKISLINLHGRAVYLRLRKRLPTQGAPQLFLEEAESLKRRLPEPASERGNYSGSYLSLPCMRWILQGVPEGKRYYAAMALSVACRKEGLPKEKALEVMQSFINACGTSAHPFTLREGQACLDWVYKRSPRFSCRFHREHGLGPEGAGYPCEQAMRMQRRRK